MDSIVYLPASSLLPLLLKSQRQIFTIFSLGNAYGFIKIFPNIFNHSLLNKQLRTLTIPDHEYLDTIIAYMNRSSPNWYATKILESTKNQVKVTYAQT